MKKRKVIIDCDPGIDDSLAIMLALKSPEIEVIGITIVCGNSPVDNLVKQFDVSQPAISRHLRILEEAKLVKSDNGLYLLFHLVLPHKGGVSVVGLIGPLFGAQET